MVWDLYDDIPPPSEDGVDPQIVAKTLQEGPQEREKKNEDETKEKAAESDKKQQKEVKNVLSSPLFVSPAMGLLSSPFTPLSHRPRDHQILQIVC